MHVARKRQKYPSRNASRWIAIWLVCLALPFVVATCQRELTPSRGQGNSVAEVNGEPITAGQFQRELDEIKQAGKGFFPDKEVANRIKRDLLERMIDERLLLQEAVAKRISVDPEILEASVNVVTRQYPADKLEKELKLSGRNLESYRAETERTLMVNRLLKQEVVDRIAISREDVEQYYQQHERDFNRPEEVRVRQIVSRSREEAEDLRRRIQRGEKFEDLARAHSLGPEGKQGGDLGFFSRGRMPPAIEDVCFKLGPSRVSSVVESPYGFHLFQLVERRPAHMLSLDEARPEIEQSLQDERIRDAERYYIRTLREKASIERDLRLIERIH